MLYDKNMYAFTVYYYCGSIDVGGYIEDNVMIIFHGSKDIIKNPQYGQGKKYNDYGLGFYCTKSIELAKEWSVNYSDSGYANEYELDIKELKILNLEDEQYTILNWLAILVDNRQFDLQSDFGNEAKKYLLDNFRPEYENYDVICGYRADDSYFSFAQDFLNNAISLNTLSQAMHLGKLGLQYVLKSEKAFEKIEYVTSHNADKDKWYPLKEKRDREARTNYSLLRMQPWKRGEIYIMNIIDKELKNDDVRV